jgi:hypothetical protein
MSSNPSRKSPSPTPLRQAGQPAPKKADVNAIVADLMEEVRQSSTGPAPKRKLSPVLTAAVLMLLLAACAWIWVAPPTWLVPPPPPAPSLAVREASMRVALVLHAQRVQTFRQQHGRLPLSAREAGLSDEDIAYRKIDDQSFEVSGRVGPTALAYNASIPRDQFLGNATRLLAGARR